MADGLIRCRLTESSWIVLNLAMVSFSWGFPDPRAVPELAFLEGNPRMDGG